MAYESFVGRRYLMAKQRSRVVSIITLIAVGGVALGVTALIVVLSVMGGFTQDLTENILGARAHIVIQETDQQPMAEAAEIADEAEEIDENIVGAAPFIETEVMVSSRTNLNGVILRGVDVERVQGVNELLDDLEDGRLEYLRDDAGLDEEVEGRRDDEFQRLRERLDDEGPDDPGGVGPGGIDDSMPGPGDGPGDPVDPPEDLDDLDEIDLPEPPGGENPAEDNPGGDGDDPAPDPGDEGLDDAPELPGFDDEPSDRELPALPEFDDADGSMAPMFDDEPTGRARVPGIIIGTELAASLNVDLGDEVNVVTPQGEMGPTGPIPRSRPFRVAGLFYSGMYEYDANHGYIAIEDAGRLLDQQGATGVEIRTEEVDDAVGIADRLEERFAPDLDVLDWQELNSSLFFALRLERIAMFVVLTFIILVASFSIVAMLIMIVIEKAREIAIMKSMGASDGGIMRIFMYQGVVIGTLGAALGLGAGLGICWYLAEVGLPLDSEVYYISTLPVEVNPLEVTAVVVCAIVISFLATLYPSYQAAQLNPVKGLRYD